MRKPETIRSLHVVAILTATLTAMAVAAAADVATVATGGYARGLQTKEMMHKIDKNGDGKVSKDEWVAYQEHIFVMLDKDKTGFIDAKEFLTPSTEVVSFSTGGYGRGMQTREMMHKIDQNGDGKVSHDEFIAHQLIVFETMDPGRSGTVGAAEFLGKGLGGAQK